MKKFLSIFMVAVIIFSLAACSGKTTPETLEIYFLNFKPEIADIYKEIAKKYKDAETMVYV